MLRTVVAVVVLGAAAASGQAPPTPPEAEGPPETRYVGLQLGLNLGVVTVDGMLDRWYLFAAASAGLPLISQGTTWAGSVGGAYDFQLGQTASTRWLLDVLGFAPVAWLGFVGGDPVGGTLYGGLGLGVGVRFLHASGFTAGLKLPVVGLVVGRSSTQAPGAASPPVVEWNTSFTTFYLVSAYGLPLLSVGYRF